MIPWAKKNCCFSCIASASQRFSTLFVFWLFSSSRKKKQTLLLIFLCTLSAHDWWDISISNVFLVISFASAHWLWEKSLSFPSGFGTTIVLQFPASKKDTYGRQSWLSCPGFEKCSMSSMGDLGKSGNVLQRRHKGTCSHQEIVNLGKQINDSLQRNINTSQERSNMCMHKVIPFASIQAHLPCMLNMIPSFQTLHASNDEPFHIKPFMPPCCILSTMKCCQSRGRIGIDLDTKNDILTFQKWGAVPCLANHWRVAAKIK